MTQPNSVVRAEADEDDPAVRVMAIEWTQLVGDAVPVHLSADSHGPCAEANDVAAITGGVGLHARIRFLMKAGGAAVAIQQQLVGAIHILEACPDVVLIEKVQSGFGEIAAQIE